VSPPRDLAGTKRNLQNVFGRQQVSKAENKDKKQETKKETTVVKKTGNKLYDIGDIQKHIEDLTEDGKNFNSKQLCRGRNKEQKSPYLRSLANKAPDKNSIQARWSSSSDDYILLQNRPIAGKRSFWQSQFGFLEVI